MQQKMFESLVRNAIDFMKTSLLELKDRPKYSVINFCSAVEIFFKARLLLEHWSLVVAKPENAMLQSFQQGKFTSVTLDQAVARLKNVAGERFSAESQKAFKALREHQNNLIHFYHPAYIGSSSCSTLDQIVSEQCLAWRYMHKLLAAQWVEYYAEFADEIEELDNLMHKHREFLHEKFISLESELHKRTQNDEKIATCSSCGYRASRRIDSTQPVEDRECLVCKSCERYLCFECPNCKTEVVHCGDDDTTCPKCTRGISIEEIIQEVAYEGVRPKEMGDVQLAYCHYCDYHIQSVALFENDWICLACLEPHDQPDHCDSCGEFMTGDLDGSGYFGCSICDGRQGHDDD